jgi:ATP-dependent Clp protease ATP-binding subunit ClpB
MLDDGRLTDGHGRTVDFRNTIIIMTSNLGGALLQEAREIDARTREAVLELLRRSFRPEFLNRIDEVVVFTRLSIEDLTRVVDIQLGRIRKLLLDKKITLDVTDAAKAELAREGFDPVYGARPLKRVLQRRVQDELAKKILAGEIEEEGAVLVDYKRGELGTGNWELRTGN